MLLNNMCQNECLMERGPARILRRAAPQNKGGRLLGPDQNLIDKAQAYLYFNLTLFSGAHLYIIPPAAPFAAARAAAAFLSGLFYSLTE